MWRRHKHTHSLSLFLSLPSFSRLLEVWAPITLEVALELLDYHFADERVRSLAVHQLEKLTNEELMLYLLQLTQVSVGGITKC